MKKNYTWLVIFSVLLFCLVPLTAQSTPIENVYHYTLENGLELFIMENDIVPLTYIELAVRGGGIAQTKETVGLFHLYEHMIFKGNTLYPTAAAVQRAIKDMGVPTWNGSTGIEYVNYFFTIPSNLTYEGLEFWSYALREPLLNAQEFENEKKVVNAEIEGGYAEPARIFYNAIYKNGFSDSPWQFDPGGNVENINSSTLEELITMKETYYVPNNTALFVGGDVEHREVYKMVKKIYGDWEATPDPWEDKSYRVSPDPFKKPIYLVQANPQQSTQIAQVSLFYRGPDTEIDEGATITADVFSTLATNPKSAFVQTIIGTEELGIPSSDYIQATYGTAKNGSLINFTNVMLSPEQNLVNRVALLADTIGNTITSNIIANPEYFTDSEYKTAKRKIDDLQTYGAQTSSGFLSTLRYFWAAASADYYFNYIDAVEAVDSADIADYFTTYIFEKPAIIAVSVNPTVYEAQKKDFENAGYTLITDENAFWWKD